MVKTVTTEKIKEYLPAFPEAALEFLLSVTEETENGKRFFDDDCFVNVMNTETKTETALMQNQVAQIMEIVYEQASISPENIKITEKY